MKTQLDVMNIASNLEKPPVYMPKKIDIKSVVNEILALELIPVDAGIIQGGEEGLETRFGQSRNLEFVEAIANKQYSWQPHAGKHLNKLNE